MVKRKIATFALTCFCSKEVQERAEKLLNYQKRIRSNNKYLNYLRGNMSIEERFKNPKSIFNDTFYNVTVETSTLSSLCLEEQRKILGNCNWIRQLQNKLVNNYIDYNMLNIE